MIQVLLSTALTFSLSIDERVERLPEEHRKWLEEEVTYIITDVERETFLELEAEEQRRAFVSAFWRRRDSNPNTIENEYREEHYRRIAYANEFLGRDTFLPGWKTDRGKYYILLGAPSSREDFSYSDKVYPAELWFYQNPELQAQRLPPFFYLLFFRRGQTGQLALYDHALDGPAALLTGYQRTTRDFRDGVELAYDQLFEVSPELAHAALSFRTDEGNVPADLMPFGSIGLLEDIRNAPFAGIDTSYAERFRKERGLVESDYLFGYVPSSGVAHVLPGPSAYYVHWAVEIDPQHLAVVKDTARARMGAYFDASIEITLREDPNLVVFQQRSESFLDLSLAQAESGLKLPYLFTGMIPVVPGDYRLRLILRNKACPGRYENENCRNAYTMLDRELTVPEVQFEEPALTDLVLGHGIERMSSGPSYRSYRFGSLWIAPNPVAVYAVGESVIALAEPLNAPKGASVRFRIYPADAEKALLERIVPASIPRTEPLTQQLPLEGFASGRYYLLVELVTEEGTVVAARRADFEISPRTVIARPAIRGTLSQAAPEIAGTIPMALGEQYLNLGRREEARAHLERALESNPRLVPALELYAPLLLAEGEVDRVIELLAPVYERARERYAVLAGLGEAYFRKQSFAQAIELLEMAMSLRRLDVELLNALAESHVAVGNTDRARELFERSLEEKPDQPAVRERLSRLTAGR